ncbi:MAG: SRPBCC family protein [Myxococcales bacterium]|nr:SRPBCC family protein [Myxococcales bacterium]
MRETSGSVIIRRPADEVFGYLRVYDNQAAWEDFVLEARSEPPGPAVVGTRVHKLRRTPIAQERFTIEIVAMDEARRRWVDVALDGDLADTRVEWAITPVPDGCRLDVRIELHAHGLLKGLMPVVWRTARRQMRMALGSLKRVLEAGRASAATVATTAP